MEPLSEPEATEDFVRELTACQEDLFVFIRTLCGNPHAAADIRQAVNMVLWRKRATFEPGTSFRSWAYRVAHFEVKSFLRRKRREREQWVEPELLDCFAAELPAVMDELPERRLALAGCIERLSAKDRELLHHRYWSSASLEALAQASGRSVGTLKARLFQVRGLLRRCIAERLPDFQS